MPRCPPPPSASCSSTLRRAGPRAAGLAAAVPINSVPVLFWLSLERGGASRRTAVLGPL